MSKRRKILTRLFLITVIICCLAYTNWGQEKDTIKAAQPSTLAAKSGLTHEDILNHAQRSLDRSINILNTVATLMGVLVGLVTAIIIIAIASGVFEYRRWRAIRKDIEKEAKVIKEIRGKAEDHLNILRDKIKKSPPPILPEKPSEEVKETLDELSQRIEFLELLGVSLKPEDYFNRGMDLYYKDKYELALKAFNRAIELKPDYAEAWNNKGVALGKIKRYGEALKAFDKTIELAPNKDAPYYGWACYNKACVYSLKGDKENALKNLSKAIELGSKYKGEVKKDEDFKNLWNDEDFEKLVS